MGQPKFKAKERVRIKGSSRSFLIQSVYLLIECSSRPSGYYYSGDILCDIYEDRLEAISTNSEKSESDFQLANLKQSKFSDNLRALIKKNGITMTELSIGSHVPRSSCYDAAYRGTPTKVSTLIGLANFFKVSLDEMMFGDMASDESSGESTKQ